MNKDVPIVVPEEAPEEPPSSSPDEEEIDLTTISGIDVQMRKTMEQIASGMLDPVIGHNILSSFELLRDGILKQLKAKAEEAFSQTRKDEIDREIEVVLAEFIDDYRRIKRNQKAAPVEEVKEKPEVKTKTKKNTGASANGTAANGAGH